MKQKPSIFDDFAGTYDQTFTNTRLGRILRGRVHRHLARHFRSSYHVLDLGCGTGEDALWLSRKDIRVTATDASLQMLQETRRKVSREGQIQLVETRHMSVQEVCEGGLDGELFDGAYSNFGVLNTISVWESLGKTISKCIRYDGVLILVLMGPACPWDFVWRLLHGEVKPSFQRLAGHMEVGFGGKKLPVWFPYAHKLRRDFEPWFKHICTESLGLLLPPTYLGHLVERWSSLFHGLSCVEESTAHFTKGLGDHYITVLRRTNKG